MVYKRLVSISRYCVKHLGWFGYQSRLLQTSSFHNPIICTTTAISVNNMFPPSNVQFYRRILPSTCIPFNSEEGRRVFTESLLSGYANIYFPLAEQFRTQDEPAYCGLSTLVMALNTLEVDPKRVWKGPWRWYHEDMLDCCFPLELVQQNGITMDQFICLATCNYLDLNVVRMNEENISIDDFRNTIKEICAGSGRLLICSYSRKGLKQTGDGHYSPIGAYHAKEDLILIMDVARYKYPPHWVKVEHLWEAMKYLDKVTELPRGYIIMRKTEEMPLLLFRLSTTFRVTIATHDVSRSPMAVFLKSWRTFLIEERSCSDTCDSLEEVITSALKALNEALSSIFEGESIFTTQFNTCCVGELQPEHVNKAKELIAALERAEVYQIIEPWVKEFVVNNKKVLEKVKHEATSKKAIPCTHDKQNCCGLKRVGKTQTKEDEVGKTQTREDEVGKTQTREDEVPSSNHKEDPCEQKVDSCKKAERKLILTDSHYITMLLLCWPYEVEESSSAYTKCLTSYIEETLGKCDDVLVNEAKQLRQQIKSLISMVTAQNNGS